MDVPVESSGVAQRGWSGAFAGGCAVATLPEAPGAHAVIAANAMVER
jgi:hypothetical protein